jgi:hypothetical protein
MQPVARQKIMLSQTPLPNLRDRAFQTKEA